MPVFAYTALDAAQCETRGTLTADTPAEGRQRLREQGLRLLSFAPAKLGRFRLQWDPRSKRRRHDQVAEIARYLSMLLHAGVPVAESLDVVAQRRTGKLAVVLKDVRDRLTDGASFGDALAAHKGWFDSLFVSAVRVGEVTGNLDETLGELADHLQAQQTLKSQLTTALTYPIILAGLGVCVIIFLMSFVIPQLLTVLVAADRPLPASTMLLKNLSDLLTGHWLALILAIAAISTVLGTAYRSERGRRLWHRFQLRLPIVGPLIQRSVVARFAQQMALLLHTGIPYLEAVQTVRRLSQNVVLADELAVMAEAIESGSDIAPTMANSRVFPPVVVHLVAVGQDSGELTAMLGELRVRYETEVRIAIGRFTAALEPLLIVVLASAVGFVVFACLMPILEATRGVIAG